MKAISQLCFLLVFVSGAVSAFSQPYVRDVGPDAIYQRALDLGNNLNVLMISLQPGFEDLGALAYYRLGRGSRILSAYVTNGEAGQSDLGAMYPHELAALRREEAYAALKALDGQVYFLNMADVAAARDSAKLRSLWPKDTLTQKLMRLISEFKPDVILLCRDWVALGAGLRWRALLWDMLEAVRNLEPARPVLDSRTVPAFQRWQVGRVLIDEGEGRGLIIAAHREHPRLKKTYGCIGEEAAGAYRSLIYQRKVWSDSSRISYRPVYPRMSKRLTTADQRLPAPVHAKLQGIEQEVRGLVSQSIKNVSRESLGKTHRREMLSKLVAVMDKVNYQLAWASAWRVSDRKALLHWKGDLEELRNALLDVKVYYTIKDTVYTNIQVGFLTIDSVAANRSGKTEILFPAVNEGWIVNETRENRFPLTSNSVFRLLSPASLDYNLPRELNGLLETSYGKPFLFFILQRGETREESFVHRTTLDFFFAPRFVVEVRTPLVRAVDNEHLVVRLTNNSRDGVRDEVSVNDSLVSSTTSLFRLNVKGGSHTDTLRLHWKQLPEDGTHLFAVNIGEDRVAQFAARRFDVAVDPRRAIGVVSGFANGPTTETLRRLGLRWHRISPDDLSEALVKSLNVLIIDHRALTLLPALRNRKEILQRYVAEGGHLVILAQDTYVWNQGPLWEGIVLASTHSLDEEVPLLFEDKQTLAAKPNAISADVWKDWIYERATQYVTGASAQSGAVLVRSEYGGHPLVVSSAFGGGKVTYIALSLHHQFNNINPGAFRLLANLLVN